MLWSPFLALLILFLCSSLIVTIIGCGLPPAPAPPPSPCCGAPPAPPPPPPCCPCPPPAPMQSCCQCAAAPPPPSHCGGCMSRRRMYSSASFRKYWRSKRETDVIKVNEGIAQKMQYINATEVPCPRAEWNTPMRMAMINGNPLASVQSIQARLLHELVHHSKFLVMCARPEQFGGSNVVVPSALKINSSGVDFCNVHVKEQHIWCQAIGMIS
ncbi:hypothetical protein ACQ4LE_009213 [Meloidogyne hapla]